MLLSLKMNSLNNWNLRTESTSECLCICYTSPRVLPYNLSVSRHIFFSKLEYKLTSICEAYEMWIGQKTCYRLKFHSWNSIYGHDINNAYFRFSQPKLKWIPLKPNRSCEIFYVFSVNSGYVKLWVWKHTRFWLNISHAASVTQERFGVYTVSRITEGDIPQCSHCISLSSQLSFAVFV